MFGWIFGKKEADKIKEEVRGSFELVKKDISAVSGWIKHLDSEKNLQQKQLNDISEDLSSIKEEIESLKNIISFIGETKTNRVFKTPKQKNDKQVSVYDVQTGVQTGVQTPNLENLSVTERAIVYILVNSDLKLSYEDLALMLGKEKSTIRGQINTLKQKNEGMIEEIIEGNGKKRVFIPEKIKEKLLKKQKVRVSKE